MRNLEEILARTRLDPATGCRIWLGSKFHVGYAEIWWRGGKRYGHRLVWELVHGPVPRGYFVCHTCDVKLCIESSHLFVGLPQDNQTDMARKHRGRRSVRGLPYGVETPKLACAERPYSARVRFRNTRYNLGYYATQEEAGAVALEFKQKLLAGA